MNNMSTVRTGNSFVRQMLNGGIVLGILSGIICPGEVQSIEIPLELQYRDSETRSIYSKEVTIETE